MPELGGRLTARPRHLMFLLEGRENFTYYSARVVHMTNSQ